MARFRKEHFGQVRYNLFFSIPESRQEPVRGKAVIQLSLKEKLPLIIDFRGDASQVASVLLNGGEVPYEVKMNILSSRQNGASSERIKYL